MASLQGRDLPSEKLILLALEPWTDQENDGIDPGCSWSSDG